VAKYRKKPVVIEAVLWNWEKGHYAVKPHNDPWRCCGTCMQEFVKHGVIETLEGDHTVCPGDWIIKGVAGEYYPIKPDIFEQTYESIT